jgi:hypothetical protein
MCGVILLENSPYITHQEPECLIVRTVDISSIYLASFEIPSAQLEGLTGFGYWQKNQLEILSARLPNLPQEEGLSRRQCVLRSIRPPGSRHSVFRHNALEPVRSWGRSFSLALHQLGLNQTGTSSLPLI